jgi:hypothetical protein
MTRVPAALVGVAAAAAVAAVVVVAFTRPGAAAAPATHAAVFAEATLTPRVVLFGEVTRADLRVHVDSHRVDPRSVRVRASFAPFEVIEAPRVRREANGVVRFTYVLECLVAACSHPGGQASLSVAPARVTWGPPSRRLVVPWPRPTVASRLSAADVERPSVRYATNVPAAGYRVDPHAVGWGAIAASAALVLGIGSALGTRMRRKPVEVEPPSSDLDRALARLERTASGSNSERRAAIGALAQALEEDGFAELAPLARRLAWSSGGPSSAVASELAGLVRAAVEVAA